MNTKLFEADFIQVSDAQFVRSKNLHPISEIHILIEQLNCDVTAKLSPN